MKGSILSVQMLGNKNKKKIEKRKKKAKKLS